MDLLLGEGHPAIMEVGAWGSEVGGVGKQQLAHTVGQQWACYLGYPAIKEMLTWGSGLRVWVNRSNAKRDPAVELQ